MDENELRNHSENLQPGGLITRGPIAEEGEYLGGAMSPTYTWGKMGEYWGL